MLNEVAAMKNYILICCFGITDTGSCVRMFVNLASLIKVTSFIEIIFALIGAVIGATYIISYIFAL